MVWFVLYSTDMLDIEPFTRMLRLYDHNDIRRSGRYISRGLPGETTQYTSKFNRASPDQVLLGYELLRTRKNPAYRDILHDSYLIYKLNKFCSIQSMQAAPKLQCYTYRDNKCEPEKHSKQYWPHYNANIVGYMLNGELSNELVYHYSQPIILPTDWPRVGKHWGGYLSETLGLNVMSDRLFKFILRTSDNREISDLMYKLRRKHKNLEWYRKRRNPNFSSDPDPNPKYDIIQNFIDRYGKEKWSIDLRRFEHIDSIYDKQSML